MEHAHILGGMRADATLLAVTLVSTLAGCGGGGLPPVQCPLPPPSTVSYGPEAAQAATTSLTIALSQSYMREKIKAQLTTGLPATATQAQLAIADGAPGAIPKAGVDVSTVRLEQRTVQGQPLNLLALDVVPWLRSEQTDPSDPSGQTMRLSRASVSTRPFTLRLRIVPHLITPATVADRATRAGILACDPADTTCAGAALSFAFYELYDKGASKVVACNGSAQSTPPDLVSQQVLAGIYGTLATQEPLRLPTAGLLSMIASMTGASANLVGMSIGTDLDLKIGLLLDVGTPRPFDPQAAFRNADQDWAVTIDPALITSQVDMTLATSGASSTPPVAFNRPSTVTFRPGELDVSATGTATTTAFACHVPVSVSVEIAMSSCAHADGTPVMRMCPGPPDATPTVTACAFFEQLFGIFVQPKGMATATVSCPTCPCVDTPIRIAAAPDDTLYITKVDTDGVFELSGRSTFLDPRLDTDLQTPGVQPRPPAPAACP